MFIHWVRKDGEAPHQVSAATELQAQSAKAKASKLQPLSKKMKSQLLKFALAIFTSWNRIIVHYIILFSSPSYVQTLLRLRPVVLEPGLITPTLWSNCCSHILVVGSSWKHKWRSSNWKITKQVEVKWKYT